MSSKRFSLFKDKNTKKSFVNQAIYLFLMITIIIGCSSIFFNWGTAFNASSTLSTSYLVSPTGFTLVSSYGDVQKPFYSLLFEISNFQPLSYPFLLTGIIIFPLWVITIVYSVWNVYKLIIKKEQNDFGYDAGVIASVVLISFLLVFFIGFPLLFQGINIVDSLSLNIGFYLMFITTILFFAGSKISKKYLKI